MFELCKLKFNCVNVYIFGFLRKFLGCFNFLKENGNVLYKFLKGWIYYYVINLIYLVK